MGRRKDRELAVRIATYREAIGCIPLALPPTCLMPHSFVGELVLHSDDELAAQASRVVQQLTAQYPSRRKDLLSCFAKLLSSSLANPGGSAMELRGQYHQPALEAMEARLETVVKHVTLLLSSWAAALPNEPAEIEPMAQEMAGSQVVRLEPEIVEIDAAGLALLAHPAAPLRMAGLKLVEATRALFFARKAAYDQAVSDRLAVLQSSHGAQDVHDNPMEVSELQVRCPATPICMLPMASDGNASELKVRCRADRSRLPRRRASPESSSWRSSRRT